jgi:hypothetical protein
MLGPARPKNRPVGEESTFLRSTFFSTPNIRIFQNVNEQNLPQWVAILALEIQPQWLLWNDYYKSKTNELTKLPIFVRKDLEHPASELQRSQTAIGLSLIKPDITNR